MLCLALDTQQIMHILMYKVKIIQLYMHAACGDLSILHWFGPKHKFDYASHLDPFSFLTHMQEVVIFPQLPTFPTYSLSHLYCHPLAHCPPPLPFCRAPRAPSCTGISTSRWFTADVPLPHSRCEVSAVTWITTNRAQLTSLAEHKEEFIFNMCRQSKKGLHVSGPKKVEELLHLRPFKHIHSRKCN